MNMKKVILIIIILIFVAAGFIGYNLKKGSQKQNELVFWTLQLGTFSEYIQPIIDDFERLILRLRLFGLMFRIQRAEKGLWLLF